MEKYLIKVMIMDGAKKGQHYYIRPGGYIEKSCQPNGPDHCYFKSKARAESEITTYRWWNKWYRDNYPHTVDTHHYKVCRIA